VDPAVPLAPMHPRCEINRPEMLTVVTLRL
jgi:hypothetical protein